MFITASSLVFYGFLSGGLLFLCLLLAFLTNSVMMFLKSYYIIYYVNYIILIILLSLVGGSVCFLMRDRKGLDQNEGVGRKELGEEGGET